MDIFDIAIARKLGGGGGSTGGGDSQLDALIDGSITEITSNATKTRDGCFSGMQIEKVNMPLLTKLGNETFKNCLSLVDVYLPLVDRIGSSAVYGCKSLKNIDLPLATIMGQYAFRECVLLESFNAPKLTGTLDTYTFYGCVALQFLDLHKITGINSCSLKNCSNLNKIVLRSDTVVRLYNADAFSGTPFASGGTGGTAYVPQALIEEYKIATNWSALYAQGTCTFLPIEGSEYE